MCRPLAPLIRVASARASTKAAKSKVSFESRVQGSERDLLIENYNLQPLQLRAASLNDSKLARRASHVCDPAVADELVSHLGDLSNKYVLELNPGPGVTTQSLLAKNPLYVNTVEPMARFHPRLVGIQNANPTRLTLHRGDFHKVDLEEGCPPCSEILANVPRSNWSDPECPLVIFGAPPIKYGLRFILSWLYKIPHRDGPFQWGRMESFLLYPAYYSDRMTAQPSTPAYARAAVLAQILLDVSVVAQLPRTKFDPVIPWSSDIVDMHLLKVRPKLNHGLTSDKLLYLDYILRLLINSKSKSLPALLKTLGPGGDELMGPAKLDPKLHTREMTPDDYLRLAEAFAVWPSRPSSVTFYADLD